MVGTSTIAAVRMGSREANENLRAGLRDYGDQGTAPRTVIHYAYPVPGADKQIRAMLMADLERRGFDVCDAELRDGIVFRNETPVASDRFDTATAELAELFERNDWAYDGWECLPPMDVSLAYWRQIANIALR